jgi:hypothetical protein
MQASVAADSLPRYELCFQRRNGGQPYLFPCSADGRVDMDSLTARALNDYLFARAVVGGELSRPAIIACTL